MSVVDPTIDELLAVTDENRFLLCEMAARRARDINDMMRNQHNRAEQLAEIDDISAFMCDDEGRSPNPLSIAFSEIAPARDEQTGEFSCGLLGYDHRNLSEALGLSSHEAVDCADGDEQDDLVAELVCDTDEDGQGGEALAAGDTEEA